MKRLLTLLFILVLTHGISAQYQQKTIDNILLQPEIKLDNYKITSGYLETFVINMTYGNANILDRIDKNKLKKAHIIQIDMVYSDFPRNHNNTELNKQRILNLLELRSDLVLDDNITWTLNRQMACNTEAEARELFHGLVIYYFYESERFSQLSEAAKYRTLPKNDSIQITEIDLKRFVNDPVIIKTLERNQWKEPTFVVDVTCSMFPYMEQIVFWFLLKMNQKEKLNISFFNDGDGKDNSEKVIGSTGGIYHISTADYKEFRNEIFKATAYGCNEDRPENDVEALISSQERFPESKSLILIADNISGMRDFSLIPQVKKPIHVILCGVKDRLNIQYLKLARDTGGSVHTLNEDLFDLMKKSEGEEFEIMGKKYIIKEGEIVEHL